MKLLKVLRQFERFNEMGTLGMDDDQKREVRRQQTRRDIDTNGATLLGHIVDGGANKKDIFIPATLKNE